MVLLTLTVLIVQNVRGGAIRKAEKLREMLEESSDLQDLRCPLPLDPSVHLAGVIPQECSVFKSALSPLRLTFRTVGMFFNQQISSCNINFLESWLVSAPCDSGKSS